MPQLRRNIVTGDWVVIAPERAKRPSDYVSAETIKPESKLKCLFCETSKLYKKDRLPEFETDTLWVFPNTYPAFVEDGKRCSERSYKVEGGFYRALASLGGHDVVVLKEHDLKLPDFSIEIWKKFFLMFKRRYNHYRKLCNAEYTMPIYNYKRAAAASIYHPHAQIFVSNVLPNIVAREMEGSEAYYRKHGECVFCAMVRHEQKEKARVLYQNGNYIAFTFYAARFPFETWILSLNHQSRFENQNDEKLEDLAVCLKKVVEMLNQTLHDPPLNIIFYTLPNSLKDAKFYDWHIVVAPRVSSFGGFELGSGMIIDVMSPEKAAEYLKKSQKA